MRFTAPEYLLLLASLIWFWRSGAQSPAGSRRIWRSVTVVLLVLGISGMQIRGGESPTAVMFVVDGSASMDGLPFDPTRLLKTQSAAMRPDDRAGVVVFGADASVERRLGAMLDTARVTSTIDRVGTNIEGALRLARTTLPEDKSGRIVLLSDGQQTTGDALREAARAGSAGVPIDVMIPPDRAPRAKPLVVTRLAAPPSAHVGEPFLITATIAGAPGARGEILLTADDGRKQTRDVTLAADGVSSTTFVERQTQPGVFTYRALAREPSDAFGSLDSGNDAEAGTVVAVSGAPRILYVGSAVPPAGRALPDNGFEVTRTAPDRLPRSARELAVFDSLVLDDVNESSFDSTQTAALAQYVDRGGGLLVLGSPRSLQPGLPADHPLRRLLPIDLRPRSGQRAPAAAIVIVFDKSGSMDDQLDGAPKIEFARQAVQRVLESISASDAVGVIAFDSQAVAVAPLATTHRPDDIARRLRAVQPEGATAIAPALELAARWVGDASLSGVTQRHVLLVSDGRTSTTDAARAQAAAAGGQFELTAVALGDDSDRRFLTALAQGTGGSAHFPEDLRQLPALLAREAARAAGGGVVREPFALRPGEHVVLSGIDTTAMPRLEGYVVGAPKAASDTALLSHLDDPILTTWRFGLGRVAVYTADLHSRWSAGFRAWEGFAPLVTQTMRWLSRRAEDRGLYARVDESGGGMRLVVEALTPEGDYRSRLEAHARVRSPSGDTTEIELRESVAGQYEARLPLTAPGSYVFAITAADPALQSEASIVRGAYWSAERERVGDGVNRSLLAGVANASGGRLLGSGDAVFSQPRDERYFEARPWLATAALVFFLIELLAPAALGLLRARRDRRDERAAEAA